MDLRVCLLVTLFIHPEATCLKLSVETQEQDVKYVQN